MTTEKRNTIFSLRLVLAPDGRVVPDLAENLPGASLSVEATKEALEQCASAVAEAFGPQALLPDNLPSMVERGLVRRIQDRIALARKAGHAVCGFSKVEQGLRGSGERLLLQARDSGEVDRVKLEKIAIYHHIPVAGGLTREELGRPFGRAEAVHVLLQTPRINAEILKDLRRLAGFRK